MTNTFVEKMERRWTVDLGLHATPALKQGWQQLYDAVTGPADPLADNDTFWSVVQLPTGTGKSQAIATLCAQREKRTHPGALIVTRFRTEADAMAQAINEIAGCTLAVAVHTDNEIGTDVMKRHPVLVITHSAFQRALQAAADGQAIASRMHDYRHWENGDRAWTIIDETPGFVEPFSVSITALDIMAVELSNARSETNMPGLVSWIRFVRRMRAHRDTDRKNRVLSTAELAHFRSLDLGTLKESILAAPARLFTSGELHNVGNKDIRSGYAKAIDDLIRMQSMGTIWKSSLRGVERLNGARLLFKHAGRKGVILDATATNDPVYELLGDRVKLLPVPEGIRDYSNVRLNVSRGHRVGKEHLTGACREEWTKLARTLAPDLSGRNVLAICHKDNVETVQAQGIPGSDVAVAHWGDIDGRNDWADCDTALLFGLQYLDDVAPANLYLGCCDTITDAWLASERAHGTHADIRRALKEGFAIRSIIQAVNRVRCRRVTDSQGGCAETDIYLLLPSGKFGDRIVSAIQAQMPGIQVASWGFARALPKASRNRTLERLAAHLKGLASGSYTRSEVLKATGIASRTFDRLSAKLQDRSSAAYRRLTDLNASYLCSMGQKEATFVIG